MLSSPPAPRKYPAVFGMRRLCKRRRRFEEAASQADHLFDEMGSLAIRIARSGQMLDLIGEGPHDGQLRSKTRKLKLRAEETVVLRLQGVDRGNVSEHCTGTLSNNRTTCGTVVRSSEETVERLDHETEQAGDDNSQIANKLRMSLRGPWRRLHDQAAA